MMEFAVADAQRVKHFPSMSTLAEIEKAAVKLSPQQMQELMKFLRMHSRVQSDSDAARNLPPTERAADWKRGQLRMSAGRACQILPPGATPSMRYPIISP